MRTVLALSVCVVFWTAVSPAAEPKLVDRRRVFPDDRIRWKKPQQFSFWAMRLSPDGKRILYARPAGEMPRTAEGAPDWSKAKFNLVLRDLRTGKETVLPIGLVGGGWRTVHTRWNPFDPTGRRLALTKLEFRDLGAGKGLTGAPAMKLLLFDVTTAKVAKTPLEAPMLLAKFDRTGKRLLIAKRTRAGLELLQADTGKFQLKPLAATQGCLSSVCPTADVACLWCPPQGVRPTRPGERPKRGPQRLVLCDLKTGKETTSLPVHERNSKLDDWETQWTPDGRYLYYYDVIDDPADNAADGRRRKIKTLTRVWDRLAGKQAGRLGDAIAVGPGPTPTSMVLAKRTSAGDDGFFLHDAESGARWHLAGGDLRLVHAWGKRVVYAKRSQDGREAAYVADIAMPADTRRNR